MLERYEAERRELWIGEVYRLYLEIYEETATSVFFTIAAIPAMAILIPPVLGVWVFVIAVVFFALSAFFSLWRFGKWFEKPIPANLLKEIDGYYK